MVVVILVNIYFQNFLVNQLDDLCSSSMTVYYSIMEKCLAVGFIMPGLGQKSRYLSSYSVKN